MTVGLVAVTGLCALAAYVLGFGLIMFVTYGFDKVRAIRGSRRVHNAALRLMALLGGALRRMRGDADLAPQDQPRPRLARPATAQ